MENKQNFTGIIIPVIVAVILLTVLPIVNSINVECPPCEEMPTLYTPTISINDDTLTITPNSNNGAFVNGYKIYVDDDLLDTTTSTTYDLSVELTEVGTYEIYVTAYASSFIDSEPSNVEEYVVEPEPTGPKAFVVGDVLPATTQLKISWDDTFDYTDYDSLSVIRSIKYPFIVVGYEEGYATYLFEIQIPRADTIYIVNSVWKSPYSEYGGSGQSYVIIDISHLSEEERTIDSNSDIITGLYWEDLNA